MKYVPPFEKVKQFFQITTIKGELRVEAAYDDFVEVLKQLLVSTYVDEAWYLRQYPDVAAAIREGGFSSAKHHFVANGYFEGRFPCEPAVDEAWYVRRYPDVAESIDRGDFPSALRHYIEDGYREGRMPFGY